MSDTLVIRADAGIEIGAGHLMRCLALAQAWRRRYGAVIFVSRCENGYLKQRVLDEGFELIDVEKPYSPQDIQLTLEILDAYKPVCIVLDGYNFGSEYQSAVRRSGVQLLVIDDYNHLPVYHADILLNQNICAEHFKYRCNPAATNLTGPRYVLLRREFLERRNRHREREHVRRILVTLGGSDPDNVSMKILRALRMLQIDEEIDVDLVVGPISEHRQALELELQRWKEETGRLLPRARLVENPSMPDVMAGADMAISSAGSTCWELAFMGVPFLVMVLADNQEENARGLDKAGIASNLGWAHETQTQIAQWAKAIEHMISDPRGRKSKSAEGAALIDGHGADRVVERIARGKRR